MATNENEVIRQHTVPVCYLANFGINGNQSRDSVVYFYNVQDGKADQSGVESFPVEKYFYDIENLGEHKQIIEKMFSEIEGELSTLLKELLDLIVIDPKDRESSIVQISTEQKNTLSAQIAMQATRTRAFRDYFKSVHQQLKDGLPFADIPQYKKADFQRLHTTEILSFGMSNFYANLFDDRHWIFLINHTDTPFLTSDNPAIMIDNRKEKNGPISPVSDEATFYFPISPIVAIEIYDKNVLKNDLRYFDIYQDKNVRWYNGQILKNCTRFLFSNKDFKSAKSEVASNE